MILICFGRTPGLHWHIVSFHVVMFLLSIQLIFSLLFLFVFSLFLYICRCSLALSRTLQVSKLGFPRRHQLLRALPFIYLRFHVFHFILFIVTPVSHSPWTYVYTLCFWTMDVFTTSWWVVNQSIVVIFSSLLQVLKLLSYLWWGETFALCYIAIIVIIVDLLLSYSRALFPCLVQLGLASSGLCPRGL